MLAQEPWCYSPDQISNLTDWQVEWLYARPAAERARQMEAERLQNAPSPTLPPVGMSVDDPEPEQLPDFESPGFRKRLVHEMSTRCGMSPAAAEAQFDKQMAAWRAGKQYADT